jgi:predicted metal-dependent hydrolase
MPFKAFDVQGIGKVTVYKRRGNRNLRLRVTGNGTVKISIPWWTPYQAGLDFLLSRQQWIATQAPKTTALLTEGLVVGTLRHLHFVTDPAKQAVSTSVRKSEVVVSYGPLQTWSDTVIQKAAQTACWRALKNEATQVLIPRLNELVRIHNCMYTTIRIKRMTSRWGSCDQRQNIVLNLFLVQLPMQYIDYVILHELAHTKALNHGPDFWHVFEAMLPNARTLKRQMRAYRPELMLAERHTVA